jgi:hypothetical protein
VKGGPLSFQSIVYLALVILAGCALFEEQEVIYLKKAMTLHATQVDIKHELGKPRSIEPLPNGETLWRYKIRKNTGGDLNGPGDTYCKRYTLRFDRQSILREWTQDSPSWRLEGC